jgi:hypothetical protein
MAGALYLWIMLAVFLGCAALIALLFAILWIGHKFETKSTGATHGFLEPPPGSQGTPIPPKEPPCSTS